MEQLVAIYRDLVGQVPEAVQPVIALLAGMVPFIEGEGAAAIGVIGGIHPVIAGAAAAAGNLLAVLGVVAVSSRIRAAALNHRQRRRSAPAEPQKSSKGRQRFNRWVVRFGVPGASLLGPLAIPTHITSATLVASGVPGRRVVLWQAVAVLVWTTFATALSWGLLSALVG